MCDTNLNEKKMDLEKNGIKTGAYLFSLPLPKIFIKKSVNLKIKFLSPKNRFLDMIKVPFKTYWCQ